MMNQITIFSVPKAFQGLVGMIQRNAIQSWKKLRPQVDIILFGDDLGIAAVAAEFQVQHLPNVAKTSEGTPLVSDVFAQVHRVADSPILTYINADIILTQDFLNNIQRVTEVYDDFLVLGRRWNLDVETELDFSQPTWEQELRQRLDKEGVLSGVGALDYFVFPKPLFQTLPDFAVGRPGWDNWMVGEALRNQVTVINGSRVITAIHQNHDYSHVSGHRTAVFQGTEARLNKGLLQGHLVGNSADAHNVLRPVGWRGKPQVSVVLTTYDHASTVEESIAQLLEQEEQSLSLDVIVVDGGSRDGTREILQQQPDASRLRIVPQAYPGLVAARNQGLALARGEQVLFLNGDSRLLAGGLSALRDCFEQHPGALELAIAGFQYPKPSGQWQVVNPESVLAPIFKGREGLHGLHIWMLPSLWQLIQTEAVLFDRHELQRRGGFAPDLSSAASTLDALLDLSSRGAAGLAVSEVVVSCPPPDWDDPGNLSGLIHESEQLLERYFAGPRLRDWMRVLEPLAYLETRVWLGSCAYAQEVWDVVVQQFKQSLVESGEEPQRVMARWRFGFDCFLGDGQDVEQGLRDLQGLLRSSQR
ncbi:glycosyltransferase family 2 protein [Geitlerinema sp. P-1104]|uniref:glycosyltransferase family 2 protein n=1 Tax=Geitlerinema sp. P-1104 TaxID=2546230 RepID=UPI001476E381|nr:glycosyltransferase family A protein [Geitlerinema sp. P-1104]NMG58233.1 glycosyltransferase family 2 protein [Geitlerinema sp. P-1104]